MLQDTPTGNHVVVVVMDSCRYDSFLAADTPNIDSLGPVERRFSYASWTAPSHHAFSMGLLPHPNPSGISASDVYRIEYDKWRVRTGLDEIDFQSFLPHLSLPRVLNKLGYETIGRVSMPVLNPATPFARDFEDYRLMENHNAFDRMVDEASLPEDEDEQKFYFFNLGETHYPYMLDDATLPIISGVHGVVKKFGNAPQTDGRLSWEEFLTEDRMESLRTAQIRAVEHVDRLIGKLIEKAAKGRTHLIVTADHGELFGEDGYFGHGPIMHPKVFEVPYVEAMIV